ncbi:hypothetical protein [Nocardioides speluncae]|uniref:hypothetical protein n=1 Tax=Nocardioides speluncae TaxID=2670337 RepID=UPI000D69A02A|nr:hypothetical protein [Nocardioides speluncae]
MSYLHLATGCSVLPLPDGGGLLLAAPDERFAELRGAEAALADVLRGSVEVPATGDTADSVAGVLDWGAGVLGDRPRTQQRGRIELAPLLSGVRRLAGAAWDADLVVGEVLDDAALLARDEKPDAGVWVPVHRELGAVAVGPVLGPAPVERPLTWADVRFRRLAASPARSQLLALWRSWSEYGDRDDIRPGLMELTGAVAALEGWLAAGGDLLRHQALVPLDGGPISAHPVLAVPRGLMGAVR